VGHTLSKRTRKAPKAGAKHDEYDHRRLDFTDFEPDPGLEDEFFGGFASKVSDHDDGLVWRETPFRIRSCSRRACGAVVVIFVIRPSRPRPGAAFGGSDRGGRDVGQPRQRGGWSMAKRPRCIGVYSLASASVGRSGGSWLMTTGRNGDGRRNPREIKLRFRLPFRR
jgi:hypothetical protein